MKLRKKQSTIMSIDIYFFLSIFNKNYVLLKMAYRILMNLFRIMKVSMKKEKKINLCSSKTCITDRYLSHKS